MYWLYVLAVFNKLAKVLMFSTGWGLCVTSRGSMHDEMCLVVMRSLLAELQPMPVLLYE